MWEYNNLHYGFMVSKLKSTECNFWCFFPISDFDFNCFFIHKRKCDGDEDCFEGNLRINNN